MNKGLRDALRPLRELPSRVGANQGLDQVSEVLSKRVSGLLGPGTPANDMLSGPDLGHPTHPLLTDLALGAWSSAVALDLIGGKGSRKAADRLIALGLIAAAPTAASGLADWSSLYGPEQRIGVVHGASNALSTAMFAMSWVSRKKHKRVKAKLLAIAAMSVAGIGGYLGAHLAYKLGVGVDHTAFSEPPGEWAVIGEESALSDDKPMIGDVDGTPIMVVRHRGRLHALIDACAHQGGPLHEGKIADGCVTCPWHQSTFALEDGEPLGGPTAFPQPTLEVRATAGKIEVRKPTAG